MPASVVIGQSNFSGGASNQGGSAGANTVYTPDGIATDGKSLFISEQNNHRVVKFSTLPNQNNAAADVVIGQTNFSGGSSNQGGSAQRNTLFSPR